MLRKCLSPRYVIEFPAILRARIIQRFAKYGFIEPPKNVTTQKFDPTEEETASLWNRLFYKGLRDPADVLDYDEACVQTSLEWLGSSPPEPWCLFLPLLFPHCPFTVEEPYFSMYDRSSVPLPLKTSDKTGHEPRYMSAIRERYGTDRATDDIWQEITATYYGMITRLDDQFGRLVTAVDKYSLRSTKPLYTFFFTDHGEYLGDSGLIEKWPSGLGETLVREPLIIGMLSLICNGNKKAN
jgi:arylsulfatase A-like enzyme